MEGFEKVAEAVGFAAGTMKVFNVGGVDVVVANVDGSFFALPNKCTHAGGPLGRGRLVGSVVQCPLHGSKFDVKTGAVLGPPARIPEPSLEVKVDGGSVWVRKP